MNCGKLLEQCHEEVCRPPGCSSKNDLMGCNNDPACFLSRVSKQAPPKVALRPRNGMAEDLEHDCVSSCGSGNFHSGSRMPFKDRLKSLGGIKDAAEMYVQESFALEQQFQSAVGLRAVAESRVTESLALQSQLESIAKQQNQQINMLKSKNSELVSQLEAAERRFNLETNLSSKKILNIQKQFEDKLHQQLLIKETLEQEISNLHSRLKNVSFELNTAKTELLKGGIDFVNDLSSQECFDLQHIFTENKALKAKIQEQLDTISALKQAADSSVSSLLGVQGEMEKTIKLQSEDSCRLTAKINFLEQQVYEMTGMKELADGRIASLVIGKGSQHQNAEVLSEQRKLALDRVQCLDGRLEVALRGKNALESLVAHENERLLSAMGAQSHSIFALDSQVESLHFDLLAALRNASHTAASRSSEACKLRAKVAALENALRTESTLREAADEAAAAFKQQQDVAQLALREQIEETRRARNEAGRLDERLRASDGLRSVSEGVVAAVLAVREEVRGSAETQARSSLALAEKIEALESRLSAAVRAKEVAECRLVTSLRALEAAGVWAESQSNTVQGLTAQVEALEAQLALALRLGVAARARSGSMVLLQGTVRQREGVLAIALESLSGLVDIVESGVMATVTAIDGLLREKRLLSAEAESWVRRAKAAEGRLVAMAAGHAEELCQLEGRLAELNRRLADSEQEEKRLLVELEGLRSKSKRNMLSCKIQAASLLLRRRWLCGSWRLWVRAARRRVSIRDFEQSRASRRMHDCAATHFSFWAAESRAHAHLRGEAYVGRLLQRLQDFDFASVVSSLAQSGEPGANVVNVLRQWLVGFVGDIRRQSLLLAEDFPTSAYQDLLDNIRRAKSAQSVFGDFLKAHTLGLDGNFESILQILVLKVEKLIERAEYSLNRADFPKSEIYLAKVRALIETGGDVVSCKHILEKRECLQRVIDQKFEAKFDRIKSLQVQDFHAESLVSFFGFFEAFRDFGTDPAIFMSLRDKYEPKLDELKTALSSRVKSALKGAQCETDSKNTLEISDIEEAIDFLPADVRSSLEISVRRCREKLEARLRESCGRLEHELQAMDAHAVLVRLHVPRTSQSHKIRQAVVDFTTARLKKVSDEFGIEGVAAGMLDFQELSCVLRFCQALRVDVPEIAPILQNVWGRVWALGSKACTRIGQGLSKLKVGESYLVYGQPCKELERDHDIAIAIRQISEINFGEVPSDVSAQAYMDTFQKMHEVCLCLVSRCFECLQSANEKFDWVRVSSILSHSRALEIFFAKITADRDTILTSKFVGESGQGLYSCMLQAVSKAVGLCFKFLETAELINEKTSARHEPKQREEFYCTLGSCLDSASQVQPLTDHLSNITHLPIDGLYVKYVQPKARALFSEAKLMCEQSALVKIDFDRFNLISSNLLSLQKCLNAVSNLGYRLDELNEIISLKVDGQIEAILSNPLINDVEYVARGLIDIKTVANGVFGLTADINTRIDVCLTRYQAALGGNMAIAKLATVLNKLGRVGQDLLQEHNSFIGYQIHLFNSKTQQQDLKYMLRHLRGNDLRISVLEQKYLEFEGAYRDLVRRFLHPDPACFDGLVTATKALATRLAVPETGPRDSPQAAFVWDSARAGAVPRLCAHLFALWTVRSSATFFASSDLLSRDSYLLRPHAAQVLAIFRLLGLDSSSAVSTGGSSLERNLVQIGTGEGKSVTLAVTSCVFALLGAEVSTACYSEYLSRRDHEAFSFLFSTLGVEGLVTYGTFNALCEREINKSGHVRCLTEALIRSSVPGEVEARSASQGANPLDGGRPAEPRWRVLLIDEVDVFFSERFFGCAYTPSCSIAGPGVTDLIMFVWQHRAEPRLRTGFVRRSAEYAACCRSLSGWEFLVDAAVGAMLEDVRAFDQPEYVVQEDMIGYKEQDGIAFNVNYGYKTVFAYLHEKERGTVSEESVRRNTVIHVKCGSFSYAEVPKRFDTVIGLTGTLDTLSPAETAVIEGEYGIAKRTYMPSIFGGSRLAFDPHAHVRVVAARDFQEALAGEVLANLESRAVLVFFPSKEALNAFYLSPPFDSLRAEALVLTEETPLQEKGGLVKRATTARAVALLTREYGRGTDFVCRDPAVVAGGGVHVVQAFLSAEVAEETQIRGRTARQGDPGSFAMVLCDEDLRGLGIDPAEATARAIGGGAEGLYEFLHERRCAHFLTGHAQATAQVRALEAEHAAAVQNVRDMRSGRVEAVRCFLEEQNFTHRAISGGAGGMGGSGDDGRSRTVLLMDATRSMNHLMQKAKLTVGRMFDRASEVLAAEGVVAEAFEMQFAVFRNYNSPEPQVLQASAWETDPHSLRGFLETVAAQGGWDNEAVEVGLWHVNREARRGRVSQVILIGDAPANTAEDVRAKRGQRGEEFWAGTRFRRPTTCEEEVRALAAQGIPVHCFYVADRARRCFQAIADATGGRCEKLEIASPAGADRLTDMVTEEILRSVAAAAAAVGGGGGGGDEAAAAAERLVRAYRAKFGKAYS